MGTLLLVIEHRDGVISGATKSAVTAAKAMSGPFAVTKLSGVAVGPNSAAAALAARGLGLADVWAVEGSEVADYTAGAVAPVVAAIANKQEAKFIVGGATATGKDLLPRVAALLDAGQASDILGFTPDNHFLRPMYAGDIIAAVEINTPVVVVSVRGSAFAADPGAAEQPGDVYAQSVSETLAGTSFVLAPKVRTLSSEVAKGGRPELGDAKAVVSGGRALGSAENFEKVIFPLADVRGAGVGASLAAVDSGYSPNDWQVWQTG